MPVIDTIEQATENIEKVKLVVAGYYKVPVEIFVEEKNNRSADVVKLRKAVVYVTKTLFPKVSFKMMAKCLGGFRHSAIRHLYISTKEKVESQKMLSMELSSIMTELVSSNTLSGFQMAGKLREQFNYISLNNVKVLRLDKTQAVVFAGISDFMIEKIRQTMELSGVKLIEYKQTGMSLITKR